MVGDRCTAKSRIGLCRLRVTLGSLGDVGSMSGLPESGHMAGIGGRLKPVIAVIAPFAERALWNIGSRLPRHSGLMLAARITLPHFSVSSAMSLPKSAGEPGSTVAPRSTSRALILGSARAALISLLSLSTISVGVPNAAQQTAALFDADQRATRPPLRKS
jgi:hypothetical protein